MRILNLFFRSNKCKIYHFALEFFYILSLSLFCFGLLDFFWSGTVLSYLNLNIIIFLFVIDTIILFWTTENRM